MMMKKKFLTILCVLIATTINVQAQAPNSKLTLKACLDIALANNIPVKQSELQEQGAKINLNQSKMNRLPNISAGVNYGINNGRSIDPYTNSYINQQLNSSGASLNASIPVFNGFQINNSIKQASFSYQASKMELQQEKDNLSLNVILAFLQLMNDQDVLALTRKQIDVTSKQVERLDLLNKEGATAPATLYDMKGQYASDQIALVNAAQAVEMSKLNLAQFMNIPYDKNMQIDRESFDTNMALYDAGANDIYNTALQNLATIKAADLRVKAAGKATQVAAASLYPSLSLTGQLGTNYSSAATNSIITGSSYVASSDYVVVNGNNNPVFTKQTNFTNQKINFFKQYNNNLGTFVGINLQIPIFSSFQTRTRVRLARLEEKRTGYVAENTRIQLRQFIEQAHLNMTSAWERYKVLEDQVIAFQESFRAAEIRFNLGALNSVEYLIVKNNLDRSTTNLTTAKYDYLLRTKLLDFYQGKLK